MNFSTNTKIGLAFSLLCLGFAFMWTDWKNSETVEPLSVVIVPTATLAPTSSPTWIIPTPNLITPTFAQTPEITVTIVTSTVEPTVIAEPTETITPPTATTPLTLTPTIAHIPTSIELADSRQLRGGVAILSGNATPHRTVSVVTNSWTAGVTTADEFGRWQQQIFFSTAMTYEIFARELNDDGVTVSASGVMTLAVVESADLSAIPNDAVWAVRESAERCNGVYPSGKMLPNNQYRIGVCQTLTHVSRAVGVYIELLLDANPQIENPSLIHPGQIINLP